MEEDATIPPRHVFIDLLIENTEAAVLSDGIYFADSIRFNEDLASYFDKMIKEYKRHYKIT